MLKRIPYCDNDRSTVASARFSMLRTTIAVARPKRNSDSPSSLSVLTKLPPYDESLPRVYSATCAWSSRSNVPFEPETIDSEQMTAMALDLHTFRKPVLRDPAVPLFELDA